MNDVLAIVGLGYVGLPVAVSFGKIRKVIGFDISVARVAELGRGSDRTGEVATQELVASHFLEFTGERRDLAAANIFIVCVPTPIDSQNAPDLDPLVQATWDVGRALGKGALVVYESTVYPGVTDETCVPILEEASGLKVNVDFWVGYSPERINPGDPTRRFETIVKVVSGSCDKALDLVDELYLSVVTAGTHRAPSIKVAEAAKVIENTQRDLNIALINELSRIFDLLDIDTHEVLDAASTKWNFLPFQPGLVGGHCIGVDPYYLTHRAEQVGYTPEVILAGRAINDSMGSHVADRVLALVNGRNSGEKFNPRVLILGATFKENCPDTRNSRVADVIRALTQKSCSVVIADPWVSSEEQIDIHGASWGDFQDLLGTSMVEPLEPLELFDAVVVTVAHREFLETGERLRSALTPNGILFDVKGLLPRHAVDGRL
jgi:UDP-N-acetyl-D-galactosamine dehydrogenase